MEEVGHKCDRCVLPLEEICYHGTCLREPDIKRIAVLRHALEMVRDADNDCHKDGLPTMPKAARAAVDFALGSIEQTDPE